jgi:hypothetical protein
MGYMNSQYRSVKPALIDQRKAYRHPVQIQRTAIREHGKPARSGELVDVSIYGCRVASETLFAEGARVWLRFADANPVAATAVWCRDGHVGCRFDDALDQLLFRRLTLISE